MGFLINLDKPANITSHQAVSKVKKIIKAGKAGHTGTLDPLATGVLIICVDEATKIARFLSGLDKEYRATIKLGQKTDTYDSEGNVLQTRDISRIHISDIKNVLPNFIGKIEQVPPMYSAVKSKGKPLYKLARKGQVIERPPRSVRIIDVEVIEYERPLLTLNIKCSKGTYIRSLANDLGDLLGVGAHLSELTRTKIGNFDIRNAVKLTSNDITKCHVPIDKALSEMKVISLSDQAFSRARNGLPVAFSLDTVLNYESLQHVEKSGFFRLKDSSGQLFAVANINNGQVKIARMIFTNPKEVF